MGFLSGSQPTPPAIPKPPPAASPPTLANTSVAQAGQEQRTRAAAAAGMGSDGTQTGAGNMAPATTAKNKLLGE